VDGHRIPLALPQDKTTSGNASPLKLPNRRRSCWRLRDHHRRTGVRQNGVAERRVEITVAVEIAKSEIAARVQLDPGKDAGERTEAPVRR
jgi:hypothetical protein